jgi:LysR family hydrogen peroxide-inducible transcriptional activator
MVSLRQLQYIVALANEGNFHRAAARCCVTQSTLSTQLKKCEVYLGVALFERRADGARLTEAGERLLPFALRALASAEQLQREAEALAG